MSLLLVFDNVSYVLCKIALRIFELKLKNGKVVLTLSAASCLPWSGDGGRGPWSDHCHHGCYDSSAGQGWPWRPWGHSWTAVAAAVESERCEEALAVLPMTSCGLPRCHWMEGGRVSSFAPGH